MLDGEGAKVVLAAKAGYAVAAGDSTGLAVAVRQLAATSAEGRLAMARNGRDYSAREFDRSLLISQLEERLSALALDRTRPRQRAA